MVSILDNLKWVFWIGLPGYVNWRRMNIGATLQIVAQKRIFMVSSLG